MEERPSLLPERLSELPQRLTLLLEPRKLRRAVGRIAAIFALSTVFVSSLVAGALLHLDRPEARRVARRAVTAALAPVFTGRIEAGEIESLGLHRVRIAEAWVYDEQGLEVIHAQGIDAEIETTRLIRSIFDERERPIVVMLPHVRIEDANVSMRVGEDFIPTIAHAFIPKDTGPPSASRPRPVIVAMPRVEIGSARVRGDVGVRLDADLRRILADVFIGTNDVVAVDVARAGLVERALLPRPISGAATYSLRVDLRTDAERHAAGETQDRIRQWAGFGGAIGQVPVGARGTMDGTWLAASAELPRLAPESVRDVFPWLPLQRTASGRVKVVGPLPLLQLTGSMEIPQGAGVGTVMFEGALDSREGVVVEVTAFGTELDPRGLFEGLPDMRVSARSDIHVYLPRGSLDPRVAMEVATSKTQLGGHVVPAVDAVLALVDGVMIGSASVREEGADVDARMTLDGGDLRFSVVASTDALDQVPRLGRVASGSGRARVDGSLKGDVLAAEFAGSADPIKLASGAQSPFSAAHAETNGTVGGKLSNLRVSARTKATDLKVGTESLDEATMIVDGPVTEPHVKVDAHDKAGGILVASATVSPARRGARDVKFEVSREGVRAEGRVADVFIEGSGIRARGIALSGEGLGSMRGDLTVRGGELLGSMSAEGVDVGKTARLFGVSTSLAGVASVDIQVQRTARGREGKIEVEVEQGKVGSLRGVSARVSAKLRGARVESSGYVRLIDEASDGDRKAAFDGGVVGTATLCDGPIAEVRFAGVEGTLDGPLLELATWKRATGAAQVAAENWNLGCLAERLGDDSPIDLARGLLTTRFRVSREKDDPLPSIEDLHVRTRGLEVEVGAGGFASHRIDALVDGKLDGKSGEVEADVVLIDGLILADGRVTLGLDPHALFEGGLTGLGARLRETPFTLKARLPRRPIAELSTLPEPLARVATVLSGEVRATLELSGTMSSPSARAEVSGFGVLPSTDRFGGLAPPLDLELIANYDPLRSRGAASLDVTLDKTLVMSGTAEVDLAPTDLVAARSLGKNLPWKAGVELALYEFPLGSIPFLSDREIAGAVSGTVSAKGLHQNPSIEVALSAPDLKLGDTHVSAELRSSVGPRPGAPAIDVGSIDASTLSMNLGQAQVQVDVAGRDGGKLNVIAFAGTTWRELAIPDLDKSSAGGLALAADGFRLGAFYPLVSGVLSKLDGTIDGKVAFEWGRVEDAMAGRITVGSLDLNDAVVYIPQFGQELREGKATIRMQPPEDGLQDVLLENVEARGSAGRVHGDGVVTFDGLAFVRAEASLSIDEGEELPVTVEGVPLGKASGEVRVVMTPSPSQLDLDVHIPRVAFQLPAASSRDVQPLDDAKGIKTRQPLGPPKEPRDPDAMRYALTVRLDQASLRSPVMSMKVRSAPDAPLKLLLSDRLHASGDILLDSGKLEFNGKDFEVDRGLVRLRDEGIGNPYVNLTAHWDLSADTRVFVDYVGLLQPITDDKIRFRSDPPRSQAEIVNLLVFGEATATGGGGSATGFVGTVGGTVATSVANDILGSAFGGALKDVLAVSVGTSDGGSHVGAQVAVTEAFSVGGTYESYQEATDARATGGCGDLYLDYKISSNWSLRGSGGYCYEDQESTQTSNQEGVTVGVDVLWQYRY